MSRRPPDRDRWDRHVEWLLEQATAIEGIWYRSVTPRFATQNDLLTGEGSRVHGGRWNRPGTAAVYLCDSELLAIEESAATALRGGLPRHRALPRTLVSVECRLQRVADLTDGAMRRRLGVSRDTMLNIDWNAAQLKGELPVTQMLAQFFTESRFEAIIVPSACGPRHRNLVYFPANLESRSIVQIVNPNQLPPFGDA